MNDSWNQAYKSKVLQPEQIKDAVLSLRNKGKKIATLNGSFDLLHAGHLHIIYEASKQADILIVALNTDSSIQQYKSVHRPLVPLEYRLQMMAAIGFVDYVTWFEETTPIELLNKIQPDIHVNGSEYGQNCIEAPTVQLNGGRVHVVELVAGLSTSELIKKIKANPT